MYFLPHLLALSSSSPFWQGIDTGLSSCRPTTYES
ncbi:TPA: glutamate-cysteine ligase family protein, partial [Legionella pneumophila]